MTRTLRHGVPVTELHSADGAIAVIADHGAHLLSWIPAGGEEALFLSDRSRYGPGDAIRGGVPIIFPQFSQRGTGKRHGFVRNMPWRLLSTHSDGDCAVARFGLTNDDAGPQSWPHRFSLEYEVRVGGQQVHMSIDVHNPSDQRWECAAALHTYLRVDANSQTQVKGLGGIAYLDNVHSDLRCLQTDQILTIDHEIDRVYLDTPSDVRVDDGKRVIVVGQHGFFDTVVWNPGAAKGDALDDLTPGDYRSFVCVEAAAVARPIVMEPGSRWRGMQVLTINNQ